MKRLLCFANNKCQSISGLRVFHHSELCTSSLCYSRFSRAIGNQVCLYKRGFRNAIKKVKYLRLAHAERQISFLLPPPAESFVCSSRTRLAPAVCEAPAGVEAAAVGRWSVAAPPATHGLYFYACLFVLCAVLVASRLLHGCLWRGFKASCMACSVSSLCRSSDRVPPPRSGND